MDGCKRPHRGRFVVLRSRVVVLWLGALAASCARGELDESRLDLAAIETADGKAVGLAAGAYLAVSGKYAIWLEATEDALVVDEGEAGRSKCFAVRSDSADHNVVVHLGAVGDELPATLRARAELRTDGCARRGRLLADAVYPTRAAGTGAATSTSASTTSASSGDAGRGGAGGAGGSDGGAPPG
jgi:uncharacterized membrane protein YgcG